MLTPESFFMSELEMEYLGLLPFAAAVAVIGLRCYLSVKRKDALQTTEQRESRRTSRRAKRTQEATLARRLLRYHRGLAHA